MADPVLLADAIEEHSAVTWTEAPGEDLAVVREDGFGHTVGHHRALQGVTDRLGRGPGDHLGAHAKARMVVDARHDRSTRAVGQIDTTGDVHLPELHRTRALPALVIAGAPSPLGRIDEMVAHQGP